MTVHANETKTPSAARERIIATAHDLFYRKGIRATGIDRVIAESGVTKVTFYRHFPSKNDLICAYLDYRHQRWMLWFVDALARHRADSRKEPLLALIPVLAEWFEDENYRGCAFINGVGEVGPAIPEVVEISRQHKQEVSELIASLLPATRQRMLWAHTLVMAVDGAIVKAQFDDTPEAALKSLEQVIKAIQLSIQAQVAK